jgi:Tfp pilus assembly protein PilO
MSSLNLKLGGSPAQIAYGIGGLLVAVGMLGSYFFLLPNMKLADSDALSARTKYETLKKDADSLRQIQTDLSQGKKRLATLGVTPELLSSIVPDTEEMPGLYIQMEQFATPAPGQAAITYELGVPAVATDGVHISVTFVAKGSYAQVKQVLAASESLRRPITINSVSLVTDPAKQVTATAPDGSKYSAPLVTLSASGFVRAKALSAAYTK